MNNQLPELTPERIHEIHILLVVAGVLIFFVALPFVVCWYMEWHNSFMRTAYQCFCHYCKRGTDRKDGRCVVCGNLTVTAELAAAAAATAVADAERRLDLV